MSTTTSSNRGFQVVKHFKSKFSVGGTAACPTFFLLANLNANQTTASLHHNSERSNYRLCGVFPETMLTSNGYCVGCDLREDEKSVLAAVPDNVTKGGIRIYDLTSLRAELKKGSNTKKEEGGVKEEKEEHEEDEEEEEDEEHEMKKTKKNKKVGDGEKENPRNLSQELPLIQHLQTAQGTAGHPFCIAFCEFNSDWILSTHYISWPGNSTVFIYSIKDGSRLHHIKTGGFPSCATFLPPLNSFENNAHAQLVFSAYYARAFQEGNEKKEEERQKRHVKTGQTNQEEISEPLVVASSVCAGDTKICAWRFDPQQQQACGQGSGTNTQIKLVDQPPMTDAIQAVQIVVAKNKSFAVYNDADSQGKFFQIHDTRVSSEFICRGKIFLPDEKSSSSSSSSSTAVASSSSSSSISALLAPNNLAKTTFGKVSCLDIDPESRMVAVGTKTCHSVLVYDVGRFVAAGCPKCQKEKGEQEKNSGTTTTTTTTRGGEQNQPELICWFSVDTVKPEEGAKEIVFSAIKRVQWLDRENLLVAMGGSNHVVILKVRHLFERRKGILFLALCDVQNPSFKKLSEAIKDIWALRIIISRFL